MGEQFRYRALVVDDEDAVRELLVRALIREGFRCDVACDGREARLKGRTGRYDAVVTDLRMPHENGHQLALHFIESADRPTVVVLTGVLEPVITKDLLVRGVDDIMFKPVDHAAFAAKVKALVERRELLRTQGDGDEDPVDPVAKAEAAEKSDRRETAGSIVAVAPDAAPPAGETTVRPPAAQQSPDEVDEVGERMGE